MAWRWLSAALLFCGTACLLGCGDDEAGSLSSWEDSVIMRFTLTSDPAAFRTLLKTETDIPAQAFPDRYKRFIIAGSMHTTLQQSFHDTQIGGVSIAQWLDRMIRRDPAWVELVEE